MINNTKTTKLATGNAKDIKDLQGQVYQPFKRISEDSGSSVASGDITAGSSVRIAEANEDAPTGNKIVCNLYGTHGTPEDQIDVYCNISGGVDLNESVRRLIKGDLLFVAKAVVSDVGAGTSTNRWYCVEGFQASQDCNCS